jgi:hypothetical protein
MIPALIGAGIGLASLINQQNQQKAQINAMNKAQEIINQVPLPVLKEYYPELYQQVVTLIPEAEQAVAMGPTAMESVATDPALRKAQMDALLKLQQTGETGMSATDQARLAQIQMDQQAALRGEQGAIQQNLAARGMGGGMSELVAKQIAAQGAANRMGQQGLDIKAQAEQRALQALMQSGQLGGQMQQQDFAQQAQVAAAKDAIARFNAANLQQVGSSNVQARNLAQQQNAQIAQQMAQQSVAEKNKAQMYNLGLAQQNYQNQLAKATGQSQGLQNLAGQMGQQQAAQNQLIGGLIQTGAQYYAGANAPTKTKLPGEA